MLLHYNESQVRMDWWQSWERQPMMVTLNFKVLLNMTIFGFRGDNKTWIRVTQWCVIQCMCLDWGRVWVGDSGTILARGGQKLKRGWAEPGLNRRVTFGDLNSSEEQRMDNSGKWGSGAERGHAINKQIKSRQELWLRNDLITSPGLSSSGSPGDFTVVCFKLLIFFERFPSSCLEEMGKWMA